MDSLRARSWWARASLGLAVLAAVVLLAFAGRRGLWLVLLTAGAVVVVLAAGFWFLQQRGVLRWLALALAVGAPLAVLGLFVAAELLWVAVVAAGAAGGRGADRAHRAEPGSLHLGVAGRRRPSPPASLPDHESALGRRQGRPVRPAADGREALGAEVALLDRPNTDVQQLARDALARGADLLGVAGGDGTQALVAQVAAEHDVPFLVISAGTRNHFALDLGLDREDPARCLDALRDGVEARIDLGDINGRPFVNNASFGAYAEIVENPAYRDDKRGTTLDTLPDLLSGRRGGAPGRPMRTGSSSTGRRRCWSATTRTRPPTSPGMGRRARLDRGVLGVIAVRVDSARQAVGLLHGAHRRGLVRAEAKEVLVSSDEPAVPVGIDGETVRLSTPVRCTVRPGALRVRLPRERPGVRPPRGQLDWATLWQLTVGRSPARDALPAQDHVTPLPQGSSPPRARRDPS